MLKANLHMHTKDDPKDHLEYSTYNIVDHAYELGFNVLSLTCHQTFVYKKEYTEYAKRKGILLIPGIELLVEKKHIVVLNCDKESEKVKTFEDLKKYKIQRPQIFILAPHPFVFSKKSLGDKLIKNIDIFDAVEESIYSNDIFNFNKKAIDVARKYNKPIIATSDTHQLKDLKRGYVLINTKNKIIPDILLALKKRDFEKRINPMGLWAMLEVRVKAFLRLIIRNI